MTSTFKIRLALNPISAFGQLALEGSLEGVTPMTDKVADFRLAIEIYNMNLEQGI